MRAWHREGNRYRGARVQVLGNGGVRSEMNITPFIDVLLVLLVIFMLTINVRQVLSAQLAREADGPGSGRAIVLELADDGRYLLNTVPVGAADLDATLRAAYAPRPDKVL